MPCCTWKCVPTAISGGVGISEDPGCHLLQRTSSLLRVTKKLIQGLVSHRLTAYLSVFDLFLTKRDEWIYQKDVNEITLNHTILKNLTLRIIETFVWILLNANLSLNQTLLTSSDDSIDSGKFSLRVYLPLIWKDSITCALLMHVLAVYSKEGLPFARDLFLENSEILTYVFDWLYFTLFLLVFPESITFSFFMHIYCISFNNRRGSPDQPIC